MNHTAPIPHAGSAAPGRWPIIDAARGVALLAMIIYHFAWDLSFLGYVDANIAQNAGWRAFAHAIAATFLALVGAGFALGALRPFDRGRYVRRLAMVGGAAALVTLGTSVAMPQAPVLFGILHCIAIASVLIVPFLNLPIFASLSAAAVFFLAPLFFTSPMFDGASFAWLGLGERTPPAVDHVPLAPWAGFVFAGYALSRWILEAPALASLRDALANWRDASKPARLLGAMGRWSLVIYLAHQPILLAILYPLAPGAPQRALTDAAEIPFRSACEQSCRANGASVETCTTFCGCAIGKLRVTPYWRAIVEDRVAREDQSKIGEVTRSCYLQAPK